MLTCIRCGQCLTVCPTYVLTGDEAEGPRGRIALGAGADRGTAAAHARPHRGTSTTAWSATPARPSARPASTWTRSRSRCAPRSSRGASAVASARCATSSSAGSSRHGRLPAAGRAAVALPAPRAAMAGAADGAAAAASSADTEALLPSLPLRFVRRAARPIRPRRHGRHRIGRAGRFFAGCVMSTALAEIDRATIRVLQRAGCDVTNTAGQGCCGALNAHSGDLTGLRSWRGATSRPSSATARRRSSSTRPAAARCSRTTPTICATTRPGPSGRGPSRLASGTSTEFLAERPPPTHTAGRGDGHLPGAVPPAPRAARQAQPRALLAGSPAWS